MNPRFKILQRILVAVALPREPAGGLPGPESKPFCRAHWWRREQLHAERRHLPMRALGGVSMQ